MNQKSLMGIVGVLLLVSLFLSFYSLVKIQDLGQQVRGLQSVKKEGGHGEELELAEKMTFLQRYSEKLYFAGLQKNWDLAEFYLEEIEETAESVIKANKMEEGVHISSQMREMLIPKIRELQEKVKSKDVQEFEKSYRAMLMNCNGCHMIAKHGFIKIREPKQNVYSQDF